MTAGKLTRAHESGENAQLMQKSNLTTPKGLRQVYLSPTFQNMSLFVCVSHSFK